MQFPMKNHFGVPYKSTTDSIGNTATPNDQMLGDLLGALSFKSLLKNICIILQS